MLACVKSGAWRAVRFPSRAPLSLLALLSWSARADQIPDRTVAQKLTG